MEQKETAPAPSSSTVTTQKSTTDVLDANGNDLNSTSIPLASIFDKIEKGQNAKDAVKEVMSSAPDQGKPDSQERKDEQPLFEEKKETPPAKKEGVQPEKKEEVKPDVKTEEKKEGEDEEIPESELTVQAHDKPRTAKRIQALIKKAQAAQEAETTFKKKLEEQEKLVKQLQEEVGKSKTQDPKVDEAIQQQLKDLAMYRRKYELERDPEVAKKFNSRIDTSEAAIIESLKRHGFGDDFVNLVKNEGGWLKFTASNKSIKVDDKTMTAAELAEAIRSAIPPAERRTLDVLEFEQLQTQRERDQFFSQQVSEAEKYFAEREANQKKLSEQQQQAVANAQKLLDNWVDKTLKENDFLKEKEIPANASEEVKKAIAEDNEFTRQLQGLVTKAVKTSDINGLLDMALESVKYHNERRTAGRLEARVKALEAQLEASQKEIDRVRKASSSVSKGGSIASGSPNPGNPESKKPRSLEEAFSVIAQGGNPLEG